MHKTKKLDSSWAIHQNTYSFQAVQRKTFPIMGFIL